jgi:hypothetical protein
MVKEIKLNMLKSSKVRFLNYPQKLYRWYITSLAINLLLYLLLLSLLYSYCMDKTSPIGDNTILSFMSTFPVAIYTDALKQKGDIFKENNKKSGIYR